MLSCSRRIVLSDCNACGYSDDKLGWQSQFNPVCCETCTKFYPAERDRPRGRMVLNLTACSAMAALIMGQDWRQKQVPLAKPNTDLLDTMIAARFARVKIIEVLDSSVINGMSPEEAATLLERYETKIAS